MSYFDDNEAFLTGVPRYIEHHRYSNTRTKGKSMANEIVKYESADGQEVSFTAQEVKERLCPNIEDKELALVMALCQAQKLNPFTKDVYITKYGNNPAQIVTGKEVFTKRAQANPKFEGMEAGISVLKGGQLIRREGSMVLPNEQLFGGWCKVYIKGYRVPMFDEVSFAEYAGRKKDGSLNTMWATKGATMIRKVAVCHALREAFPDDFQGLYGSEEMGVEEIPSQTPNPPAESTTAPENVIESAEFVEMASEGQLEEYSKKAIEFAELYEKSTKEVDQAVLASNTLKPYNVSAIKDMTAEEITHAINLLSVWIDDTKATQEAFEEVLSEPLADEDIDF